MPWEALQHLVSPDPRARAAARLAGLLRYARSRLTPGAYAELQARLVLLGLPSSPADIQNYRDSAEALQAILDLVRGLTVAVDAQRLPCYSILLQSTLSTTGLVVAAGASFSDAVTVSDFVVGDPPTRCGSLNVIDDAAVSGNVRASTLNGDADGGAAFAGLVAAERFRLLRQMGYREAAALVAAGTTFFEHPVDGLSAIKASQISNEVYVPVGGPGFDTGWLEISAHYVGDPLVNPPYEMTFPLKIMLSPVSPGDRRGIVDAQAWVRSSVIWDGAGPHVLPGASEYGFSNSPGGRWFTPAMPLQNSPSVGSQLMVASDGSLTLRVGVSGMRIDGATFYTQARVVAWLRGHA